jgi:hypothetical protein
MESIAHRVGDYAPANPPSGSPDLFLNVMLQAVASPMMVASRPGGAHRTDVSVVHDFIGVDSQYT